MSISKLSVVQSISSYSGIYLFQLEIHFLINFGYLSGPNQVWWIIFGMVLILSSSYFMYDFRDFYRVDTIKKW